MQMYLTRIRPSTNEIEKEISYDMIDQDSIGIRNAYDQSTLLQAIRVADEVRFYSEPKTDEELLEEYMEYRKELNVDALLASMNSMLETVEEHEATEKVVDDVVKPYRVRMKKGDDTRYALPSNWASLIEEGYVPSLKVNRDYPIVTSLNKEYFIFTCNHDEIEKYEGEGRTVVKF